MRSSGQMDKLNLSELKFAGTPADAFVGADLPLAPTLQSPMILLMGCSANEQPCNITSWGV